MRTGCTVIDAVGTIMLRRADTASGIPIECPPPSTSDTVGFFIPAISSAMASPCLNVAAHGVQQNEQPVDLLALLHGGQQRQHMLIFVVFTFSGSA